METMHEDIVTRFMTKPYSMPVNHHHCHALDKRIATTMAPDNSNVGNLATCA
jgi:hypothetical protein